MATIMRQAPTISCIFTRIAIFFCLLLPQAAFAQQCNAPYEMITQLHHPSSVSYSVWDTVFDEKQAVFKSALPFGDEVLAVGRSIVEEEQSLVFVYFDVRGRIVWHKEHKIKGLLDVVKMQSEGSKGVSVLVNRVDSKGRAYVALLFFDVKGVFLKSHDVRDENYSLTAQDINKTMGSNNRILSITMFRRSESHKKHAGIYHLNSNSKVKFRRQLILGTVNEILGLRVSKKEVGDEAYIATGYFENKFGKKIAYVGKTDTNFVFQWQQEFRRGQSAILSVSSTDNNGQVLVMGDVVSPHDDGLTGVWLAALDGRNGRLVWQRYYYAQNKRHDYTAVDLNIDDGGLITLLMQAKSRDKGALKPLDGAEKDLDADYIRKLTLTPRGVTVSGETYHYDRGVEIHQMTKVSKGHHVMVGGAVVGQSSREDVHGGAGNHDAVNEPLREKEYVSLPDAVLSDEAQKGLALLKKNIKEGDHHSSGGGAKKKNKESAESIKDVNPFRRYGWVVIGEGNDAYTDPCK